MEKSVETLEAMFQKTESNLDYLSRKLDFEFDSSKAQTNPVQLVQKVAEIKKEYAGIVHEAVAIQEAQKDAMDYFRSQLLSVSQMLERLQTDTVSEASTGGVKPEVLGQLEELLGVAKLGVAEPGPSGEQGSQDAQDQGGGDNSGQNPPAVQAPVSAEMTATVSAVDRRDGCHEFLEVSQSEFESVSTLVRARAKLVDINSTYTILWRHFKEEGNSAPLNAAAMHKMGLRVTGATGEAKLKVLRALKLLNMTTKGDVTLV